MEGSKLNFNAPFLSVRRISAKPPSLDEKAEKITRTSQPDIQHPHPVILKPDQSFDHLTEPASVPFVWEQAPGRPKDERHCPDEAPKHIPDKITGIVKYPLGKYVEKEKTNLIGSGRLRAGVNKKLDSHVEEECDIYSDVPDTLSKTDSFSMNCSANGLSGFDDRGLERSGTFSADQQTRDFMMNRFLPAAKAMTLEQPQHSSKKQLVPLMPVKPSLARKAFSGEIQPPINRNRSIILPAYHVAVDNEESEDSVADDDKDHDVDISFKSLRKGCGFLPQLCLKSSLCILNRVPALKVRTHSLISSSRDNGKSRKTVKKNALDSDCKDKSFTQSPRLSAIHSKLSCRSSRALTDSCEQFTPNRSSPYRRSACSSPYRSVISHSPFREAGFPGSPRDTEILRAYRLNKHVRGISRSQEFLPRRSMYSLGSNSPVKEKTLYVDSVSFVKAKPRISSSLRPSAQPTGMKDVDALESLVDKVKAISNGENKLDSELDQELNSLVNGDMKMADSVLSPLPPPLPKTPSESWLWRTLPSVASSNPFSQSRLSDRLITKKQDSKPLSSSTKWETIVKTSYLHHDHIRYSEELIPYSSHKSKP